MYKVFFDGALLELSSTAREPFTAYQGPQQWKEWLEAGQLRPRYQRWYASEPQQAWEDLEGLTQKVEAAGGLVYNEREELLMIRRLGRWDLPKGKMEKGEEPAGTALREVSEECGIPEKALQLGDFCAHSYHIYPRGGALQLKTTYWYYLKTSFSAALEPQQEEDITQARWCDAEAIAQNLQESYGNIRLVLGYPALLP